MKCRVITNRGTTTAHLREMFDGSMEYWDRKHLICGVLEIGGVHIRAFPGVLIEHVIHSDSPVLSTKNGRALLSKEKIT